MPDVTKIKLFLLFAMSLLTLHAMLHVWSHGVTSNLCDMTCSIFIKELHLVSVP